MKNKGKNRKNDIITALKNISEEEKAIIFPLVDEIVFLEAQMQELKKLPFVAVHPKNPAKQKSTAAAREYKSCSQSYMNAIRILISLMKKTSDVDVAEFIKLFESYE